MDAIRLEVSEVRPLRGFVLAGRWTRASHGALSDALLAEIRPLATAQAASVAQRLAEFDERDGLRPERFRSVHRSDATDVQVTSDWLRSQLPTEGEHLVVVSWDANTAVVTTCELFVSHWDDFCYPSSDDVLVAPPEVSWVLRYHHEGEFQLGRGLID